MWLLKWQGRERRYLSFVHPRHIATHAWNGWEFTIGVWELTQMQDIMNLRHTLHKSNHFQVRYHEALHFNLEISSTQWIFPSIAIQLPHVHRGCFVILVICNDILSDAWAWCWSFVRFGGSHLHVGNFEESTHTPSSVITRGFWLSFASIGLLPLFKRSHHHFFTF